MRNAKTNKKKHYRKKLNENHRMLKDIHAKRYTENNYFNTSKLRYILGLFYIK